jgi:hypothetical protein
LSDQRHILTRIKDKLSPMDLLKEEPALLVSRLNEIDKFGRREFWELYFKDNFGVTYLRKDSAFKYIDLAIDCQKILTELFNKGAYPTTRLFDAILNDIINHSIWRRINIQNDIFVSASENFGVAIPENILGSVKIPPYNYNTGIVADDNRSFYRAMLRYVRVPCTYITPWSVSPRGRLTIPFDIDRLDNWFRSVRRLERGDNWIDFIETIRNNEYLYGESLYALYIL